MDKQKIRRRKEGETIIINLGIKLLKRYNFTSIDSFDWQKQFSYLLLKFKIYII